MPILYRLRVRQGLLYVKAEVYRLRGHVELGGKAVGVL